MILPGPAALRAGSGWALASVAVAFGSSLVRTIVVARCLAPEDIGLMGIALLALGFLESVASTGVDTALVAKRTEVEPFIDAAFTIQLVRGVAVFLLLWITAPAVARFFENDTVTGVIRSVGVIAALRGLANPATALAIRGLEFRRVFWWSVPEPLSALAVTIVLALARRDVWALVIGVIVGQVVGAIASYGLAPRLPNLAFARHRNAELLRFGRFVSGSRALMYCSVNLDSAVVGTMMGVHALGLYQFATRVSELPVVTFTRAIAQVALPALSRQQTSGPGLRRTWNAVLWPVLAVNVAAAVLILLFAGVAVEVLVGGAWRPAVPLMRVLAFAMVFRAVVVLAGQLLDGVGRPALTMRVNAVRLGLLAALLPALALSGGLHGIPHAVLLANAIAAVLAIRSSAIVLADPDVDLIAPRSTVDWRTEKTS